jgi:hypothetical protein
MKASTATQIRNHGLNLLLIFKKAAETDPIELFHKLRRLENAAEKITLRLCNGPSFAGGDDEVDELLGKILSKVNALLGNVHEYQPKTGRTCSCKRGVMRDNCSACEGTGFAINFSAIRNRTPLVPVIINRDPRGFALKIDCDWPGLNDYTIHKDMGGYGILAPEL